MGHACEKLASMCIFYSLYLYVLYTSKIHHIHECTLHKLSIHMNGAFKTFKITDKVN